jgi:Rod binding domain-containing protein
MNISPLTPHIDASEIAPERLAKNPKLTEQQKIAEASRQFESILLKQVLESSQKTVIKSKFTEDSTSSSIYHDMVTTQLADSISKSGKFGLAKTFEQQLDRPHGPRPDGLPDHDLSSRMHAAALKPLHPTHGGASLKPLHADSHGRDGHAAKIVSKKSP